jgi:hypothetical protein
MRLARPSEDPPPLAVGVRRQHYGYTNHGSRRSAQRWRDGSRPPAGDEWDFAFEVPKHYLASFRMRPSKGRRVIATRDALAVVARSSIVTVMRVGWDRVDDLRATILCRAMGLPVSFGVPDVTREDPA